MPIIFNTANFLLNQFFHYSISPKLTKLLRNMSLKLVNFALIEIRK